MDNKGFDYRKVGENWEEAVKWRNTSDRALKINILNYHFSLGLGDLLKLADLLSEDKDPEVRMAVAENLVSDQARDRLCNDEELEVRLKIAKNKDILLSECNVVDLLRGMEKWTKNAQLKLLEALIDRPTLFNNSINLILRRCPVDERQRILRGLIGHYTFSPRLLKEFIQNEPWTHYSLIWRFLLTQPKLTKEQLGQALVKIGKTEEEEGKKKANRSIERSWAVLDDVFKIVENRDDLGVRKAVYTYWLQGEKEGEVMGPIWRNNLLENIPSNKEGLRFLLDCYQVEREGEWKKKILRMIHEHTVTKQLKKENQLTFWDLGNKGIYDDQEVLLVSKLINHHKGDRVLPMEIS